MGLVDLFGKKQSTTEHAGPQMVQFSGPCPFCGKMIEQTAIDPCGITVTTKAGKWQTWSCHAACFKAKMVDSPNLNIVPLHF